MALEIERVGLYTDLNEELSKAQPDNHREYPFKADVGLKQGTDVKHAITAIKSISSPHQPGLQHDGLLKQISQFTTNESLPEYFRSALTDYFRPIYPFSTQANCYTNLFQIIKI